MLAFKCDICGAYYEPYNYFLNQSDEKPNSLMTYDKREYGGEDNSITRYDVCPRCMKAFNDMVETRKRLGPSIRGD